jgi:uncharacterized coiled-coil DUF342 family protein
MSRTVTEALLDKIDQQDKEIERLEADAENLRNTITSTHLSLKERDAEIERLRKHLDACSDTCGFQARQIKQLQRALALALEDIRDQSGHEGWTEQDYQDRAAKTLDWLDDEPLEDDDE